MTCAQVWAGREKPGRAWEGRVRPAQGRNFRGLSSAALCSFTSTMSSWATIARAAPMATPKAVHHAPSPTPTPSVSKASSSDNWRAPAAATPSAAGSSAAGAGGGWTVAEKKERKPAAPQPPRERKSTLQVPASSPPASSSSSWAAATANDALPSPTFLPVAASAPVPALQLESPAEAATTTPTPTPTPTPTEAVVASPPTPTDPTPIPASAPVSVSVPAPPPSLPPKVNPWSAVKKAPVHVPAVPVVAGATDWPSPQEPAHPLKKDSRKRDASTASQQDESALKKKGEPFVSRPAVAPSRRASPHDRAHFF